MMPDSAPRALRACRRVLWQAMGLVSFLCGACDDAAAERSVLTVFAAASLIEAFGDLEHEFEARHPHVDVRLTLAGSQVLRLQIEQGAPADVFASADVEHVRALARAGHADAGAAFARNGLVVITPPDNPAGIDAFADLPRARRLVIGAAAVPVGAYTRALLSRAEAQLGARFVREVRARVASEESSVRLVRAKVAMGEADAAIVYRTDAMASSGVRRVPIPASLNVHATYFISRVLRGEPAAAAPAAFVAYVRSEVAGDTLRRRGFEPLP